MQKLLETIRVESCEDQITIFDLEEHISRLFNSIEILKLGSKPLNLTELIQSTIQDHFPNKNIKSKKTDFNTNSVNLYKTNIIYDPNNRIEISIEPYLRDLNKTWQAKIISASELQINLADQIWQHKFYPRPEIKYENCDEMIWINDKGYICEGSFTNIFFQDQLGDWHTPSLENNILPGIMRAKLIPVLNAKEGFYTIQDLESAKEIRLTNSMIKYKIVSLILFRELDHDGQY